MMKIYFYILLFCIPIISTAQTWEVLKGEEMENPISCGGLIENKNVLYFLGGYNAKIDIQKKINWIMGYKYGWTIAGQLKYERSKFVNIDYKDKIYIFGGESNDTTSIKTIEYFNKDTLDVNTTKEIVSKIYDTQDIFHRISASGEVVGDNFFMFGGFTKNRNYSKLPYVIGYNISQKKIIFKDTLSYGAENLPFDQMTAKIGKNIYIFGGASIGVSQNIYKFDTEKLTFSKLNISLLSPRAGGKAVFIPGTKMIYIIGGYDEKQGENEAALKTVEIFTEINDSTYNIKPGAPLILPRKNFMAIFNENKIQVFGGYDDRNNIITKIEFLKLIETGIDEIKTLPINFELKQNYPNPFNPSTKIEFFIKNNDYVSLEIFSVLGEIVFAIKCGYLNSGNHEYFWDGNNSMNQNVSSGTYFYRIKAGGLTSPTKKMQLIR